MPSFIGDQLEEFTPEDKEYFSTSIATIQLFDRHGNRENMARNRMRYLVHKWDGINFKG